jgi:hypothetical protein
MKKIIALAAVLFSALVLSAQPAFYEETLHKQAPAVPKYMVFAGDTVRFDRHDLYERMDREMIAFTYMHSNSVLMLRRSKRIFSLVVPILKKNGIPEDLKYLMAIESNLDPKAVSTAGAAGLWQFMKGTAQEFGLEVNTEVDERFHIEKETEAACRYLKNAYAKYGDWLTVAASYNAGQAGISRRREEQKQESAFDLWMPEETSRYIFRILAAKRFFLSPASFGFENAANERYPEIAVREIVTVGGPVESWADFAIEHGTTYYQLRLANLWIRDMKLTNKKNRLYRVIIPEETRRE